MSNHSDENHSNLASARSSAGSRASLSIKLPVAATQEKGEESIKQENAPAIVSRGQSHISSGTMAPAGTPTKVVPDKLDVERIDSVYIIERAWLSYRDRQMFRLLKHAICAAEHSLSHEIMRKVCPKEAEFLKDKCVQSKVRFRFGGSEFPPLIYFKIFTGTQNGMGVKYLSGRRMIKPASEAAQDACDIMGHRKFLDQVIQDAVHHDTHKITDQVDVTTLKDYMQYLSILDETPSYMGGRDNFWRKLTLEALPRQTIFYDVVEYLLSRQLSSRLQMELPSLLVKPVNQDMQMEHIRIISEVRSPSPSAHYPTRVALKSREKTQTTGRRTKQAKTRASKMRKMYEAHRQENTPRTDLDDNERSTPGFSYDEDEFDPEEERWEEEANKLFEWTQELSYDDIAATPRLATSQTLQSVQ